MAKKQNTFATRLLEWHGSVDRLLPWKSSNDPYRIWLSEIIMQQTRIAQGTPYYLRFVEAYPDIVSLADAPEESIMKLWQGLGYYSRARNLHFTAKYVRDHYKGVFPRKYEDILALKGIGKYTAAAIVSFAYGDEYPVVDGNVLRVISRYYGITDAIDHSATIKHINKLATQLIKGSNPADYNQAIMDFGALFCTPKSPNCSECTFNEVCIANKKNLVAQIPYKAKKIKKKTRHLHYLIIQDSSDRVIIHLRGPKDIWQALYDFPLIERTDDQLTSAEIEQWILDQFGLESLSIEMANKSYKHILTHQTIHARFHNIKVDQMKDVSAPFKLIKFSDISNYPLPVLITNYLKDIQL